MSSTGNITGVGTINDDATAAGSVVTTNLTIGGIVTQGVTMPAVPTQTFPQITSSTAPWIASGYTLVDLSTSTGATLCAKARDWIMNRWSTSGITNALIRINTTCTFSNPNNDTFSVLGNLAILIDGGFNFSQQSNWNGTTGTIKHIHFISVYSATCSGTTKDISVGNNTNFNTFTNVSFYTPCLATMSNQNAFSGQVLSKDVSLGQQLQDDLQAGPRAGDHGCDGVQAGHLLHPRVIGRRPPTPGDLRVGFGSVSDAWIRAIVALPFGLGVGSFMTVAVYRLPEGRVRRPASIEVSVLRCRDRCPRQRAGALVAPASGPLPPVR